MITKEYLYQELIVNRKTLKQLSKECNKSSITLHKYASIYGILQDPNYIPICSGKVKSDYIKKYITKDILYQKYVIEKMSALQLSEYIHNNIFNKDQQLYVKCDAGTIISLLHQYQINTRNISEALLSENTQLIRKETCLKKYGVDCVSKCDDIKKKKIQTFLKNYGVTNCFSSDIIKTKTKQTLLKKYGAEHMVHTKYYAEKMHSFFRNSRPQKCIENYLLSINFEIETECYNLCKKFNSTLNRIYSPRPDIFLPQYNTVIEIYGDYWHANPLLYKEYDIIYLWIGKTLVKDIWEKDKIRINHINDCGFNDIIIWEHDIKNNFENVKKILKELHNVNTNKIN